MSLLLPLVRYISPQNYGTHILYLAFDKTLLFKNAYVSVIFIKAALEKYISSFIYLLTLLETFFKDERSTRDILFSSGYIYVNKSRARRTYVGIKMRPFP